MGKGRKRKGGNPRTTKPRAQPRQQTDRQTDSCDLWQRHPPQGIRSVLAQRRIQIRLWCCAWSSHTSTRVKCKYLKEKGSLCTQSLPELGSQQESLWERGHRSSAHQHLSSRQVSAHADRATKQAYREY